MVMGCSDEGEGAVKAAVCMKSDGMENEDGIQHREMGVACDWGNDGR